ncbi:hypothetical protein RB620_08460 [Paenibacillus sp. LHD-117]|nr:hypothetical protein [Paenibacillus sp. LHD-117]MDQ6419462.1 hypothetical protein [Paenibacillus sp. LHD-117]
MSKRNVRTVAVLLGCVVSIVFTGRKNAAFTEEQGNLNKKA